MRQEIIGQGRKEKKSYVDLTYLIYTDLTRHSFIFLKHYYEVYHDKGFVGTVF